MFYIHILLLTLLAGTTMADTKVYVAVSKPSSLETYHLSSSGKLTHLNSLKVPETPMTIASSQNKQMLYMGLRDKDGKGRLLTINVEGEAKIIGNNLFDFQLRYLTPDHTGKYLFFADYFGGKVGSLELKQGIPTGILSCSLATEKYAHCIKVSPDNKHVLVPHTAPNKVYQFTFDPNTGQLTKSTAINGPQGNEENRAPRHMDWHPQQPFIYSSNEHKGGISFWQLGNNGVLTLKQSLSTLPVDFVGRSTAADVHVTPNGKYIYVSNRGGKGATSKAGINTLSAFKVDSKTGKLTPAGFFPTAARPRSFAISGNSEFVICAGQADKKLFVFRLMPENGALEKIKEYSVPGKANWVIFHKR